MDPSHAHPPVSIGTTTYSLGFGLLVNLVTSGVRVSVRSVYDSSVSESAIFQALDRIVVYVFDPICKLLPISSGVGWHVHRGH
jgi:hypothetical protein